MVLLSRLVQYYNDGNGSNSGHVRIYDWNESGSVWVQRGSDIDGKCLNNQAGSSVSLSADGNIVAIGAYVSDTGNNIDRKSSCF